MNTIEPQPIRPDMVTVNMTIPAERVEKLHAFMASDTYEKAKAARDADLEKCRESLVYLVRLVREHSSNSTRGIARVLCSHYNGDRVQVDMTDLRLLDAHNFEHVMNVIRLLYETNREPHTFFVDGGRIFESIIADYRLEKRRRRG